MQANEVVTDADENEEPVQRTRGLGLAAKFILLIITILAITMAVTTFFLVRTQNQIFEDHLSEKGRLFGRFVSVISPEAILSYDFQTLDAFMVEATRQRDIAYGAIFDTNGEPLTSLAALSTEATKSLADANAVTVTDALAILKHQHDILHFEFPIDYDGREIGKVAIGVSEQRLIKREHEVLETQLLGNFAVIVLLSICIYLIYRHNALKPIMRLIQGAECIARGKFDKPIVEAANDEIGYLTRAFNLMMRRLKSTLEEKAVAYRQLQELNKTLEDRVRERTEELVRSETRIRAVIDHISEGVITVDEDGRIESVNPAAEEIFRVKADGLIGTNYARLLATDHPPSPFSASAQNLCADLDDASSDRDQPFECEGLRMDGTPFPMELMSSAMHMDGRIKHVCIVRDTTRRREAEKRLHKAQQDLVDAAHKAGMAEMAIGVLHNIGNILNSVSVSAEQINLKVKETKVQGLLKANELLREHKNDVAQFLSSDPKGQMLPDYYLKLGYAIEAEIASIADEATSLAEKTMMMKDVIATQQEYARSQFHTESMDVHTIIEDALKIQEASLKSQGIRIDRRFSELSYCAVHKSKLLQIITNLIKNAKEAMAQNDLQNKVKELSIETGVVNHTYAYISVADNGCGIDPVNLDKIFGHGFTTKDDGHGFGLHASANAMTEMKGSIKASSDGLREGACFTLTIPFAGKNL